MPDDELSPLSNMKIETYFSEDHPASIFPSFPERSQKMLYEFIERLVVVVRLNPSIQTVYFHNLDRYKHLTMDSDFIFADKLSKHYYIVSYLSNTGQVSDSDWSPPRISAVQLAAAITACARIHMYPYISRPDCYYTDTDSVVLGSPLPEGEISSTVLGKFKLEYIVKTGIFLAPKSYSLETQEGKSIIKHKGLAKALVNEEWFESQYADLSRTIQTKVESNFRIDWETLNICKKDLQVNLGIRAGSKRVPVFDNNIWVDTEPLDVTDFAGQESRIRKYDMKRLQEQNNLIIELLSMKEKENVDKEREIDNLKSEVASLISKIENLMAKRDSLDNSYRNNVGKTQSHSALKPDDTKQPTNKTKAKGKKKKKKPG